MPDSEKAHPDDHEADDQQAPEPATPKDPVTGTTGNATGREQAADNA